MRLSVKNVNEFAGVVEGGRLPKAAEAALASRIRSLDGKWAVVTVSEKKPKRSLEQNALYWSCIVRPMQVLFRQEGDMVDEETVHRFLMREVGGFTVTVTAPDGSQFQEVRSSTGLTTEEFNNFITAITVWATERGIVLPLPEESISTSEREVL